MCTRMGPTTHNSVVPLWKADGLHRRSILADNATTSLEKNDPLGKDCSGPESSDGIRSGHSARRVELVSSGMLLMRRLRPELRSLIMTSMIVDDKFDASSANAF